MRDMNGGSNAPLSALPVKGNDDDDDDKADNENLRIAERGSCDSAT